MSITRKEAAMIAEELYKKVRNDVIAVAKEITKVETEEYYTPKDVAKILGWSQCTVYRRKDDLGCYVKIKSRLLFPKSKLHLAIQSGRL